MSTKLETLLAAAIAAAAAAAADNAPTPKAPRQARGEACRVCGRPIPQGCSVKNLPCGCPGLPGPFVPGFARARELGAGFEELQAMGRRAAGRRLCLRAEGEKPGVESVESWLIRLGGGQPSVAVTASIAAPKLGLLAKLEAKRAEAAARAAAAEAEYAAAKAAGFSDEEIEAALQD